MSPNPRPHSESALRLLLDARRTERRGPTAVAQRPRTRLAEMVAFARSRPRTRCPVGP